MNKDESELDKLINEAGGIDKLQEYLNKKKQEAKIVPLENYIAPTRKVKHVDKKSKVQAQKNTWVDTGEEQKDAYKLIQTKQITENRPIAHKKTVTCSVCHKDYQVSAKIETGSYYRCERCTR